jgi:hypothetical protein
MGKNREVEKMKMFFAGSEAFHELVNKHNGNMLMSYYHIKKDWKQNPRIKQNLGVKQLLFIDSGAFSAFSLGSKIDIDEYIKFCKETDAEFYAVLDVIGSAQGTLKNQEYMEDNGVNPVPCFHYGDDWKYLEHYCENYDFVALGGMVPIPTKKLIGWLDSIFSKYPKHKFHGFGLTTTRLVNRYPWFSVDSSSWIMGGKTGALFDIVLGTKYFKEINDKWKQEIIPVIADLPDYNIRNEFNILSYLKMQNEHNVKEFRIRQNQLTDFGLESSHIQPSKEQLLIEARDHWIKDNYGDIPRELGLKLWRHHNDACV